MTIGIDLVIMTIACAVATILVYLTCSKIKGYDYDASTKITTGAFCSAAFMVASYLIMSCILDYFLGLWW